jgi:hypothetical protein
MASASSSNPNSGFQSLHYGGSMNPKSGTLSPKPQQKSQFRKLRRYETIVRLENAGFTLTMIAGMLTISKHRLAYIMKQPDYLIARTKITHGIILDQDSQLDLIKEQGKELLKQCLPAALQVLANELQSPGSTLAERKHKVALAQDLMDREGTFAKVSRSEVKLDDKFDFESADTASRSVIHAIRSVAPAVSDHSKEAIEANTEFSMSHTLSAIDQQVALKSLEDAAETGEMAPEMLELVPPVTESVN